MYSDSIHLKRTKIKKFPHFQRIRGLHTKNIVLK